MGIFSSIGSGIAGGIVGAITDPIVKIGQTIADAKVKLAAEKNSAKRIELEEIVAGLEAKRDVMIAASQSGDRTDTLMRALIATPWIIYWFKVIVFDMVFGAWTGWSTPPLPPQLAIIGTAITSFYLLTTWRR